MIIGGISCGTALLPELNNKLKSFSEKMPYGDRFEWKQISKRNEHVYIELLDWFCEANSEHLVDFHALVVDMHRFDHHRYNDGDREVSFDKMLFQSMFALHKRYRGASKIRCFHANRDSRYPINNLREILNSKVNIGKISGLSFPFSEVKHMEIKKTPELQLADLLIGCTGFFWNERKGSKKDSPKGRVAKHFYSECPVETLSGKSAPNYRHFDIWEFKT